MPECGVGPCCTVIVALLDVALEAFLLDVRHGPSGYDRCAVLVPNVPLLWAEESVVYIGSRDFEYTSFDAYII